MVLLLHMDMQLKKLALDPIESKWVKEIFKLRRWSYIILRQSKQRKEFYLAICD